MFQTRRNFLKQSTFGLGAMALAHLFRSPAGQSAIHRDDPARGILGAGHHPARAKTSDISLSKWGTFTD